MCPCMARADYTDSDQHITKYVVWPSSSPIALLSRSFLSTSVTYSCRQGSASTAFLFEWVLGKDNAIVCSCLHEMNYDAERPLHNNYTRLPFGKNHGESPTFLHADFFSTSRRQMIIAARNAWFLPIDDMSVHAAYVGYTNTHAEGQYK